MADTQGDSISIDAQAFAKFKAELDGIVKGLDDIGDRLGLLELKFRKLKFNNIGLENLTNVFDGVRSFKGVGTTKRFEELSKVIDILVEVNDKVKAHKFTDLKEVSSFLRALSQSLEASGPGGVPVNILDRFKDLPTLIDNIVKINNQIKGLDFSNITRISGFLRDLSKAFAEDSISLKDAAKLGLIFGLLAPAFKLLGTLVAIIPDGGQLTSLSLVFRRLGQAFNDLSAAFSGNAKQQFLTYLVIFPVVTSSLFILFKGLSAVLSFLPGENTLAVLGRVFKQLGDSFLSLSKTFGNNSIVKTLLIFGVAVPLFSTGLFILFKGLAAVLSIIPGDETLKILSKAFYNIGIAFTQFNNVFGKNSLFKTFLTFGVLVPIVFVTLSLLFRGIASILKLIPGSDALDSLAKVFRQIGQAFQRLTEIFNGGGSGAKSSPSATIATVIKLGVLVPILFAVLGGLFKGIALVLRAIPDQGALAALASAFQAIGQAFKNFNTVLSGGLLQTAGQVVKFAIILPLIIKSIAGAFKAITSDLVRQGLVDEFLKFTKSFRNIGEGIKSLAAGNAAISIGGLISISVKMKILATVIKSIAQSAKLGENNNAETLGTTIRSIGKGFASLAQAISVMDKIKLGSVATVLKLVILFKAFTGIINTVKAVAKSTSAGQLEAAGKLFEATANVFKSLFDALSSTSLNQTNVKGVISVSDRLGFIKDVFKQLSSFKGKKLPDLAGIIGALPALLAFAADARPVDATFKTSMKNVADGLNELRSVKLNGNQADAIAKVLGSFSGLTQGKLTGNDLVDAKGAKKSGETLGEQVAQGVEAGLFRFDIKKKFVELFVSVSKAIIELFNPIRIFKGLFSGLTTLVEFGAKIVNAYQGAIDKLKQLGTNIQTIGNNVKSFGENLLSNFGVGGLLGSEAFKSAAGFDQLTTEVKTFGNLTEAETKKLRGLAFQLGKDFPLSANEALSAAKDLIKAGLDTGEIQKALPIITELTSLTDSKNIGVAAKGIIQVVSTFKEFSDGIPASFDNAAIAANLLSQAADNSQASVESLIEGLGNVGGIASQFGLTLKDTVSVLGLFSNAGIQGAEAGTALKSLLKTFTTDAAQKEFKRLGISITDATGNYKDINTIINEINASFTKSIPVYSNNLKLTGDQKQTYDLATKAIASAQRNLLIYQNQLSTGSLDQETANKKIEEYQKVIANATNTLTTLTGDQKEAKKIVGEVTRTQEQNVESLLKLAGTYGAVGLSALLAAGDNGIGAFQASMDALPSAGERARQLLDNFNGDVLQLQGSLETLFVQVIEPTIATVFRPFVQVARAAVDAFISLDPEILATVGTMISFGSIIATVVGTLAVLGGTVASIGGSVIVFAASLLSVQTIFFSLIQFAAGFAVGLASIAVVALPLIAIGYGIAKAFRTLIKIFSEDIGGAGSSLKRFANLVGRAFARIIDVVSTVGDLFSAIFGQAGSDPILQAGKTFSSVFDKLADKVLNFTAFLYQLKLAIKGFTEAIQLGSMTSAAADELAKNPIIKLLFGLRGESATGQGVSSLFVDIRKRVRSIREAFSEVTDSFTRFFRAIGNGADFGKSIQRLLGHLKASGGKLASQVIQLFADIFKFDPTDITDKLDAGNIIGAVQAVIGKLFDALKNFLLDNRAGITSIATTIFSFVFSPGKMIATILRVLGLDAPAAIIEDIGKAINSLFKGVVDFAFNLLSGEDVGTAFSNAFRPVGLDVVNAIIDAIKNAFGLIGSLFGIDTTSFIDQLGIGFQPLVDALDHGDAGDVLRGLGTAVTSAISTAIQVALTAIGSIFGIDTTSIVSQIAGAFKPLEEAFQTGDPATIFGSLANAVTSLSVTAIELALQGIGKLFNIDTQIIIDQIVEGITPLVNALNTGDPVTILSGLFAAFSTVFGSAIQLAVEGIGSVLGIDVTKTLDGIKNTIQTNIDAANTTGPGGIFFILANSIVGLIGAAISTALAGIGEFLNIDTATFQQQISDKIGSVVTDLQNIFLGADGTSIFDNISTTIDKFAKAFSGLFAVFTPAAGAGVQATANPLDAILSFFTKITTLTLSALETPLKLLDNLFEELAAADPEAIKVISAAIVAIAGALVVKGLLDGTSGISKLVTSLKGSALVKGAALFVIIDFINLLLEASKQNGGIHSFADVLSVLGTALANLGLQILDAVGLTDLSKQIRTTISQISTVMLVVGNQFKDAVDRIFRDIRLGFEGVVVDALITAQKVKNGLNLEATAGLDAGVAAITGELSRSLANSVTGSGDLQNAAGEAAHSFFDFFNQNVATGVGPFGDPVSGPLLKEKLRVDFLKNLPDVLNILAQQYAAKMASGDVTGAQKVIADSIPTLIFTGGIVDAAKKAAQDGNLDLLQTIIRESAKQGASKETLDLLASQVQSAIDQAFASGDGTKVQAARTLLDNLIANAAELGIDPAKLKLLRDNLDKQIAVALNTADGKGTPVDVKVDPKVEVTGTAAELQAKARAAAEKRLNEADKTQGVPVPVTIPVTASTEATQTKTDADQVSLSLADLALKLVELKLETQTTKDSTIQAIADMTAVFAPFFEAAKNDTLMLTGLFIGLGIGSTILAVTMGLSAIAIVVAINIMSAVLTPFLDHAVLQTNNLNAAFSVLALTMLKQVPGVVSASILLGVAINKFADDAVINVNKLLDKVQALSDKLSEVAGKFAAIAGMNVPGGGGGDGKGGGAGGKGGQAGITTYPDRLYQVVEANEPELYQQGGKTYLIPSSKGFGQVVPAINQSSVSGTTTPIKTANTNTPVASSSTITYNEGDISVVVNGGNASPREIAQAVQAEIQAKQAEKQQSVKDRLRTAAR